MGSKHPGRHSTPWPPGHVMPPAALKETPSRSASPRNERRCWFDWPIRRPSCVMETRYCEQMLVLIEACSKLVLILIPDPTFIDGFLGGACKSSAPCYTPTYAASSFCPLTSRLISACLRLPRCKSVEFLSWPGCFIFFHFLACYFILSVDRFLVHSAIPFHSLTHSLPHSPIAISIYPLLRTDVWEHTFTTIVTTPGFPSPPTPTPPPPPSRCVALLSRACWHGPLSDSPPRPSLTWCSS